MVPETPYPFVTDLLGDLPVQIKRFFGGYGLYLGEKIILIMYAKEGAGADKGIWVATEKAHHESLRRELPTLRSIRLFSEGETNWQVIPEEEDGFERDVTGLCELIRRNDSRVGRIPKKKKKKARKKA